MEFKGSSWHESCFVCQYCRQPLGTKPLITKDNENYCVPCFEKQFAHHCYACKKVIKHTMQKMPWWDNIARGRKGWIMWNVWWTESKIRVFPLTLDTDSQLQQCLLSTLANLRLIISEINFFVKTNALGFFSYWLWFLENVKWKVIWYPSPLKISDFA